MEWIIGILIVIVYILYKINHQLQTIIDDLYDYFHPNDEEDEEDLVP